MDCNTEPTLFGIPPWHVNLDKVQGPNGECNVQIDNLAQLWDVALAILEIMLRFGAYIAVFFIVFGGVSMIMSSGNPERISQARSTIINAIIGLVVTISAIGIVSFIAGRF